MMNTEPQSDTASPASDATHTDQGDITAPFVARVLERPDPALPIVEATLVVPAQQESRPEAPPASPDADAARQVRAARRREMLGIFFTHTPGRLTPKREAAYQLLQRVA